MTDPSFKPTVPQLDLSDGPDMLNDFSREAQRHLISARNSLLVLETVPSDKQATENIFKTFHTIKGLADFLNLHDICCLTSKAELLLDRARKDLIDFEGNLVHLTKQSIASLQKLLELLDDQINNSGKLKGTYLDISPLISDIEAMLHQTANISTPVAKPRKNLPTINFEPDLSTCTALELKLTSARDEVVVSSDLLEKLINDFKETGRQLKDLQSKLHERQRELIRERELAIKLTQQAQAEARAKSEYLANMSHEIRTLINAILGFTELLKDGVGGVKQKEHLNTIILSGKMLLGIVNDILDYSKVEAGKIKLENIDLNLLHIIEEVFKIIRTRLNSKPINLYFKIADPIPLHLKGDPTRLKQIFINLLENAIKFTEKGEIGLEVALDTASNAPQGWHALRFSVKDSGIGIPANRRHAIFESFTQADTATTRIYGGSGLGLTLCKNFVETMGGKIWVESEVGQGSQFIFTMKLAESTTVRKTEAAVQFPDVKVMLMDSHDISAQSLAKLCKDLRVDVLTITQQAKQSSEFLLKLESEKKALPNIIFIDTILSDKEGFMLAYKIRQQERYKNVTLVAISCDVKLDLSEDFRQAGFNDFLAKPVTRQELIGVISRQLSDQPSVRRNLSHTQLQKISCDGIKVLVVEDSVPNQELLKVHFGMLGCVCDYAANGQEALDQLKGKTYDICFMDLQMPVMGGLEATKKIRQTINKTMPIVALTAAELQEEKDKCYEVGMNDYLAKPFELEELKEKIIRCTKM